MQNQQSHLPAGGTSEQELRSARRSVRNNRQTGILVTLWAVPAALVTAECVENPASLLPAFLLVGVIGLGLSRLLGAGPRAERYAPALLPVVAEAAGVLGLPLPAAVGLQPLPVVDVEVHAFPRRRVVLRVGAPLLLALDADDLRVLIAHRLAVLQEPDPALALSVALHRTRYDKAEELLAAGSTKPFTRRAAEFMRTTDAFGTELESRADAAAVLAAGSRQRAAEALLRARYVAVDLQPFVTRFDRMIVKHRHVPREFFSGWARSRPDHGPLRHDRGTRLLRATRALTRAHPSLANAFADAGLPGTAQPPLLDALPARAERALVRMYVQLRRGRNKSAKAVSWEAVPLGEIYAVPQSESPLLEPVGAFLGAPATAADLVGTAAGPRWPELWAVLREHPGTQPGSDQQAPEDPAEFLVAEFCAAVVTRSLLLRGYRRADPLRPYRMTASDGREVYADQLTDSALDSAEGLAELRRLLSAPALLSGLPVPGQPGPAKPTAGHRQP